MNSNKYRRDPHSKALILNKSEDVDKFLEKQRLEQTVYTLKDEIHTLRLQMQEILSKITQRETR